MTSAPATTVPSSGMGMHERREQLQTRPRQRQREKRSANGQDQALDDQLPDEPEPGRAERQTERHLTAAP